MLNNGALKKKANGICAGCSNPAVPGRTRCQRHLNLEKMYSRKRRVYSTRDWRQEWLRYLRSGSEKDTERRQRWNGAPEAPESGAAGRRPGETRSAAERDKQRRGVPLPNNPDRGAEQGYQPPVPGAV